MTSPNSSKQYQRVAGVPPALQGRSFKGQDLSGADFSNADIRSADFTGANLTGANFSNAKTGLSRKSLILMFLFVAFLSTISGLAVVAACSSARLIAFRYMYPEIGAPVFLVVTFLVFWSVRIANRQGIQKALIILSLFLIVVVILTAVLGSISNSENDALRWLTVFRSENFIYSMIEFPGKTMRVTPVSVILYIGFSLFGTIVMLVTLAMAVVLAEIIGDVRLVKLAVFWTEIVAAVISGNVMRISVRIYGAEQMPLQAVVITLATALAIKLTLLNSQIAKDTLAGDEKHLVLRQIAVFLGAIGGTSFRNANLTDANFTEASFKSADLRNANTTHTLFQQAKHLDLARLGDTILIDPKVRDLLVTGDGYEKSYIGVNLQGANLTSVDLRKANLKGADLNDAALQAANLNWANLTEVQAIDTDFTCARMTGVSLENWNIDNTTKLDNVESKFVYLLENPKPETDDRERRPNSGEFGEGEFTKLFTEVLDTVDLIFRNGIDWKAFMSSFKQLQVENEGTELNIQSVENKGDRVVVVKVNVPPETDKAKIHGDFVQIYEETVKSLEEKHQAELESKEGQLAIYRQQNENMMSFLNHIVPSQLSNPHRQIKTEKIVVISFNNGDFETGFAKVQAQIWSDGNPLPLTFTAELPPKLEIPQLYRAWHDKYEYLRPYYQVRGLMLRIKPKTKEPSRLSDLEFEPVKKEFQELGNQLGASLNLWLNSPSFNRIQNQLRMQLNPSSRVRLIIQAEEISMRRLPWHKWDFFNDYRTAEVAISNPEGNRIEKANSARSQIRILAILGNDKGIDVEADRKFLESLPEAETVFLVKPTRQELDKSLWDEKGWDILCFSGHSESKPDGNTGYFMLEDKRGLPIKLTIDELENALREAIRQGLQLAIFNSCDGLGLARQLADLHIPQIIVMREPVPDKVAQEFLKNFLGLFSRGKSLYVSVRKAREMLQGLEDEFPCASWLPVICQNQAEMPKTWQEFLAASQASFEILLAQVREAVEAEGSLTAEDKTEVLKRVEILTEIGIGSEKEERQLSREAMVFLRGIIGIHPAATLMNEAVEKLWLYYLTSRRNYE